MAARRIASLQERRPMSQRWSGQAGEVGQKHMRACWFDLATRKRMDPELVQPKETTKKKPKLNIEVPTENVFNVSSSMGKSLSHANFGLTCDYHLLSKSSLFRSSAR